MKKLITIALANLIVSSIGSVAFAQNSALVPGSDAGTTAIQNQSRENVQERSQKPMGSYTVEKPTNETFVPGNTQQIDNNEADERNAVAAGTAAETMDENGSISVPADINNNPTGSADDSGSKETASPMELQQATPAKK